MLNDRRFPWGWLTPKRGGAKEFFIPVSRTGPGCRRDRDNLKGALTCELESLRLILEKIGNTPVLFTAFSPMTIASKLTRGGVYRQVKDRENVQYLHAALEMIAADVRHLSEEAIALGAKGVFFAHQDTGRIHFNYDDFSEFVRPYDLEALIGAQAGAFNVLHLHGDEVRFHEVKDYPVDALNWHVGEARPSLAAMRLITDKTLVGGLNRWSIIQNDMAALKTQVDQVRPGCKFADIILTPGCTIRCPVNVEALTYIRDRIHGWRELNTPSGPLRQMID